VTNTCLRPIALLDAFSYESESVSRPLVGFGVLNDNLIKYLISFVEVHEQILSNRYKGIHGYITQSTIMMQMELCDQCVYSTNE
jgi:hypothetical protein